VTVILDAVLDMATALVRAGAGLVREDCLRLRREESVGRTRTVRRTQCPQRFQPVAARGGGVQHTAPCEKIQSNFISILSNQISLGVGVQLLLVKIMTRQ